MTNQNSSDLSVLDIDARQELRRIPVPGNPAGVAVAADGSTYTVSPDTKTVRRIDPETGATLAETVLDGGPIGIALDADHGRVFVSDWYNARIWALDAGTLAPLAELETGSAPAGLAVAGGVLASADRDADQVSLFTLSDLRRAARVTVGTRPFGLGFAPDGRLFVGNVGSNDVSVIDPATARVTATLPVGDRPYGVGFAAGRVFVTNQYADTVSVFDLATLAPLATIPVGEYPEGIDSIRDTGPVVVANWFSNTVSLIDPATLQVVGEIATGDGPRAFGRFILQR
ncbi:YncE family protein [Actibacterium ureilyticum]|uniref:YncE family protein n=1 Tax=Actibacterium ureilyticum TaxID=1590614 RepID=UPI001FE8F8CA|nr:YncE family protein [Actibacterium ureilyticum]